MKSLESLRRNLSFVAAHLEVATEMAKTARNCRYRTSLHALTNEIQSALKLATDQLDLKEPSHEA